MQNRLRKLTLKVDGYKIEFKSAPVFGDTATTLLEVRCKPRFDGKEGEALLPIRHTWQKNNSEWRIIGGMSCNVDADGTC